MGKLTEADELTVVVKAGPIRIIGPIHCSEGWLEPRKWWQFWLPRLVEKRRSWVEWPGSLNTPDTNGGRA